MDLLTSKNYFNYKKEWVDIVKQENVPALIDNSAAIAFDKDSFKVTTKPHGHGDIHTLLYQSGVAKKWEAMGKKWMIFIQDTNSLALKVIPSAIGVSAKNDWEMNSICIQRKPGEAVGAICKLLETDGSGAIKKELVVNVEYN